MDIFDALKAIAALAFVLGILLGFAWLLRKYGGTLGIKVGQDASDLRVVEWRSLDMRRKLAVIRWDGRDHLMSLGPANDVLIASRVAPLSPAKPDGKTDSKTPEAANDEAGS
ncbi:MAG: flagellar biosynthetic protein FliO [Hyphomonadaceae bacterium]|nr:flagellar biosynthetic protein FliO [Hyphomonadaceae bacterium]